MSERAPTQCVCVCVCPSAHASQPSQPNPLERALLVSSILVLLAKFEYPCLYPCRAAKVLLVSMCLSAANKAC